MASPTAWSVYDLTLKAIGNKEIDLDSDTYKVCLFASTSNVGNNALSPATYANATNELATANGYTAGGAALGSPTWSDAAGTETWDVADASWTPSGPIMARYAAIRDVTTGNLICWSLLDSADVNMAGIAIDVAGVLQMLRG